MLRIPLKTFSWILSSLGQLQCLRRQNRHFHILKYQLDGKWVLPLLCNVWWGWHGTWYPRQKMLLRPENTLSLVSNDSKVIDVLIGSIYVLTFIWSSLTWNGITVWIKDEMRPLILFNYNRKLSLTDILSSMILRNYSYD